MEGNELSSKPQLFYGWHMRFGRQLICKIQSGSIRSLIHDKYQLALTIYQTRVSNLAASHGSKELEPKVVPVESFLQGLL